VIGVISKVGQEPLVEEFFELFKTPWEFYQPGRIYEVIVATVNNLPEVDTRLLLLYCSQTKNTDAPNGIIVRSRDRGGFLDYQGIALPIYGDLSRFEEESGSIPFLVRVVSVGNTTVARLGYDLFQEVQLLLSDECRRW
jgi:hypothetical protein